MQIRMSTNARPNEIPPNGVISAGSIASRPAWIPANPPTSKKSPGNTSDTARSMKKKNSMSVTATPIRPPIHVSAMEIAIAAIAMTYLLSPHAASPIEPVAAISEMDSELITRTIAPRMAANLP